MREWVCIVCDKEIIEQLHHHKIFTHGQVMFPCDGQIIARDCYLFPLPPPVLPDDITKVIELFTERGVS